MDRRGIRRTKAVHVNPVSIYLLGIVLYLMNVLLFKHQVPWWNYAVAFLVTFLTGFITYYIQSRFAENSSPLYFAVFLFLANVSPDLVVFNNGMLAALCMSMTFLYVIKFICEEQRRDYIVNAIFFCAVSSIIAPSFIWFSPMVWLLMIEESDRKGNDTLVFLISALLSYVTIFGTLYLFKGFEDAWKSVKNWAMDTIATAPTPFWELPITSGLLKDWHTTQFAHSVELCFLALIGICVIITYFTRRSRLKSDDISISKVSITITIFSIVLEWFSADTIAHWPLIVAMISVPTSHILASEGRHILIRMCVLIAFLLTVMSVIPVFELLSPYLR